MSLINDALKQARKGPPRNPPTSAPPLKPAGDEASLVPAWLWPSVVVLLIAAAIFFIGWSAAHRTVSAVIAAPETESGTQSMAAISLPPVQPQPGQPPPPVTPPSPNPPSVIPADAPHLQGIFYSTKTPSAILDGKTARPGDQFGQYRVKAISKYTVTLVGPDKKEFQIGMGN